MTTPDEGTQTMLNWAAASRVPSMTELSPDEARALQSAGVAKINLDGEPVHRVENRLIDGPGGALGLRIYWPSDESEQPICVYLHGGGFVIGDLDTHDPLCRRLANRSGAIVVSVDYRLAPEHRYPAAVDDAVAALGWAAAKASHIGGDPARLAVAGDSAGGNLAAVASHRALDAGGPPLRCQALIYPVTDHDHGEHASRQKMGEIFPIPIPIMAWFHEHYFGHAEPVPDPDASPLRRTDLTGLPPTLMVTAGLDPLCDEGRVYAKRLGDADVDVRSMHYDSTIHGFLQMGKVIPLAATAIDDIGGYLAEALASS
ncbi:MAG: alpha/beta hydrolase fold domain-containing protein [Alphaproteobacteria bacterium]|nr:alpha/beta hydrolase fold domain-containing protein [Alphaproteobacteria bacterium]